MTIIHLQLIGVLPSLRWLPDGRVEFTDGNIVYRSAEPLRFTPWTERACAGKWYWHGPEELLDEIVK